MSELVLMLLQQQQQQLAGDQRQLNQSQTAPFIASTLFIDCYGLIYALRLLQAGNKVIPTRPSVVTAFQRTDTDTQLLI